MQKHLSIILFLLFCFIAASAQTNNCFDLGALNNFDTIKYRLLYYSDFSGNTSINQLTKAHFSGEAKPLFSGKHIDGSHFMMLPVCNSGTDDTFLLYMGRAQTIAVYEFDSVSQKMQRLSNRVKLRSSLLMNVVPYYELKVKPGERKDYFIQAELTFYNWQQIDPILLLPYEKLTFEFEHILKPSGVYAFITLILLGIMFSMFVYTLLLFIRSRKKEYLYCSGAIFIFFLYFLLRLINVFAFTRTYYFFYDFRYQALQLIGNVLLLFFISSFLKLKIHFPSLHRLFKTTIAVQLIFLAINIPITYANRFNYLGNIAFDIMRVLVLLFSVYLIISLIRFRKEKEALYLAIGSLLAIALSALALVIDRWSNYDYLLIRNSGIPVLIFMVGVLLQSFLFLQALSYRSRKQEADRAIAVEQLQLENDRKELEKYKAIIDARENERNRISQEIHDDIGSGLTSIRLMSEIAKAKSNQSDRKELDKISATSSVLMDKMNEIIWTLNSRNDTLPNLVAYLRHHVVEYFEPLQMQLQLTVPEQVHDIAISSKIRRNILMSVQEALHNIAKHSQASEVHITFSTSGFFCITISDNGIGFNESKVNSFNNGLYNMKDRLHVIGGSCDISNDEGTSIVLKVPLANYPL